ncbi:dolichol phosphate mannosyltransferas-like protein subunit 3 [Clohesyomyces aquaticus]|uniref:Dolichol-phosphate mannosyltransferase subunit 3 n=1 Tax=Clohesyomyces aquaticus TaxID=1231657 RepID=A0A1Y1YXM9_9PLEO|nr:dolichol phosphate mannosyltransferas-like protein subunit 3 [Clohesyomyces aquaticus]
MTRAQQTISIAMLLSSVYLACFMEVVSFPEKIQKEVIPVLPFWALVSFGSYLLFKLGLGVFTFNDVPEAHKEIMDQIQQARKELQANGVDVGND